MTRGGSDNLTLQPVRLPPARHSANRLHGRRLRLGSNQCPFTAWFPYRRCRVGTPPPDHRRRRYGVADRPPLFRKVRSREGLSLPAAGGRALVLRAPPPRGQVAALARSVISPYVDHIWITCCCLNCRESIHITLIFSKA